MADLNNAWDAEDFEPEVPGTKPEGGDQWAGEDSKAANKKILAAKEEEVKKDQPDISVSSLDQMMPISESEFDQFSDALKSKIEGYQDIEHFSAFVVQLINELTLTMEVEEVKKLGINMNSLFHEKDRLRKETDKKKKKKSKITINMDRADDLDVTGGTGYYEEDDDEFI